MTAGAAPPGTSSRLDGVLVLGRVLDQGSLGMATLLLARWLPLPEFALVSVLLIVNSVAVTLADLGVGYAVLATKGDSSLDVGRLHRVRGFNAGLVVCGLAGGVALGGTSGGLLAASTLVWAAAGESYVRGAGALRVGNVRGLVKGQALGAAALLVTLAMVQPGRGLGVLAFGLVAKQLSEAAFARGWNSAFSVGGDRVFASSIFVSQAAALILANVDFIVAAAVLGRDSYAIYLVAFRFVQIPVTLLANVLSRTAIVNLTNLEVDQRQALMDRNFARLFAGGAIAGVGLTLAGPALASVLGPSYDSLPKVIALLAVSIPWRMVAGQAGALFIVQGRAGSLAAAFVPRLLVAVGAMAVGASLGGMRGLLIGTNVCVVLTTTGLLLWSSRIAGLRTRPALPALALGSITLTGLVAAGGSW